MQKQKRGFKESSKANQQSAFDVAQRDDRVIKHSVDKLILFITYVINRSSETQNGENLNYFVSYCPPSHSMVLAFFLPFATHAVPATTTRGDREEGVLSQGHPHRTQSHTWTSEHFPLLIWLCTLKTVSRAAYPQHYCNPRSSPDSPRPASLWILISTPMLAASLTPSLYLLRVSNILPHRTTSLHVCSHSVAPNSLCCSVCVGPSPPYTPSSLPVSPCPLCLLCPISVCTCGRHIFKGSPLLLCQSGAVWEVSLKQFKVCSIVIQSLSTCN